MKINFLKIFNKKFAVKVFVAVTVFLFVISFSFTTFFIYQQSRSLIENLEKNGTLLTGILAYSVRLGVFSEDRRLLENTVEGIFQQENVLDVSVSSLERELLKKQKLSAIKRLEASSEKDEKNRDKMVERFKANQSLFCRESSDRLEFWSPVMSGAGYATEESLLFEEDPLRRKRHLIGFVKLTVDKTGLKKTLTALFLKGSFMGILFLIIGSGGIYLLLKRVTKPLNRLTEGVRSLGMGGEVKKMPVETDDEIGRLAQAFNTMSDSLKKREAEKKELENQLRHAQKMEAIGTLAGGISHDFNNIITAIVGYGNLLLMRIDEKDSSLKSYAEQILSAADRAVNLNQSLLAFSRKQLIEPKPININEGIKNVKKLLTRLIREDIQINLDLAEESLIVMADSGQIDQVLMNLTTNARDAMPDGGSLTIETESVELKKNFFKGDDDKNPGRYALLSVSDTGIGMDEETRGKIFDPFFTTKEVGKGTGLGLSMIYGIIKQHKGYINISSEPGKGSTFKMYLPLIDLPQEEKGTKLQIQARGGTEIILIAEDDEALRTLSTEVLEQAGYTVIEAKDGEDAVSKFIEHKEVIQLLLLDVIMPKKNGKEAYEKILTINPDIKALFLSGYTSDIINEKGIIEEGINFIAKPVTPEALLLKVREVLDT
ncbi:MAG: response regulator [Proteobacteria bacterium]|nr:response regulator [Pseudomonadota bacterium]